MDPYDKPPTHRDDPSSWVRPPVPTGVAFAAPGARGAGSPAPPDRATVTRSLQKVIEKDPFFSPLPEIALARESTIEDGPEQTIFLMRDRRCDRMVVLKMLKGEKSDARTKRFLRETLILGRLSHPSIPPVLDLGCATNGQPFIVLPRTQGLTLDEQIADAENPATLVATIARAAEAIAHAHSVGVVHGKIASDVLKGDWVVGWESARDLTGKVEDVGERVTESTDVEALKDLVAQVGEKFQQTEILALADKDYREAQALALELRELLQASRAPEAPAPSGGKGGFVVSLLLGVAFLAAAAAAVVLFLRTQNLDKDVAAQKAEIQKRNDADKKREASEKARSFIADAQVKARAGDKESVKKLVKDAQDLEKSEAVLMGSALALAAVGETNDARPLLRTCVTDFPPAFAALLALHDLDPRNGMTDSLKELVSRAKERSDGGVYVAVGESVEASDRKDWPRALQAADRAVVADPTVVMGWVCRATAHAARGQLGQPAEWDAALADWDRAIDLDPHRARSFADRSLARAKKGQFEGALDDANRALRLDPQLGRAYTRRARAQLERGEVSLALNDLERAIQLTSSSGDAEPYVLRGIAREKKGDLETALKDLDTGIQLDNHAIEARIARGLIYIKLEKPDKAVADLEEAVRVDPKNGPAYGALGEAHLAMTLDATAKGELEHAIDLDPKNPRNYRARAKLKQKTDLAAAIVDYDKAIELDSSYTQAYLDRAFAKMLKKDWDGGESDCSRAIDLDKKYAAAWNNRGFCRYMKGDYDQALADLDEAIKNDPHDGPRGRTATQTLIQATARKNKGLCYLKKENWDEAVKALNDAIGLKQDMWQAWVARGDAKDKKGDKKGAQDDYERSLAIAPESSESGRVKERIAALKKEREEEKKKAEEEKKAAEEEKKKAEEDKKGAEEKPKEGEAPKEGEKPAEKPADSDKPADKPKEPDKKP